MNMRKLVIGFITALCLFTASVAEGFCCVDDQTTSCTEHQEHSKKPNEQHKDMGSHSCCHAHYVVIKAEKFAVATPISMVTAYSLANKELVTQHKSGVLLEPPARA
mgnify:CR=1 FL=1